MKHLALTLAVLIWMSPLVARADNPTATMELWKRDAVFETKDARARLFATSEALRWANVFVTRRGDSPLFCPPSGLAINEDMSIGMFRQYVNRHSDSHLSEYPGEAYPAFMLWALQEAFPCK